MYLCQGKHMDIEPCNISATLHILLFDTVRSDYQLTKASILNIS
jgi:hypothetical protein